MNENSLESNRREEIFVFRLAVYCAIAVTIIAICWPFAAIAAINHYHNKAAPELYPAWIAAHPEAKDLTFKQWKRLWESGLLKSYR
jgi:hypothetical protein